LFGIWLVIMAFWYIDIDGVHTAETFLYYQLLLFILTLPGSLLLLLLELVVYVFIGWDSNGGADPSSLSEARWDATRLWAEHLLIFLIQMYLVNKWIIKKVSRSGKSAN